MRNFIILFLTSFLYAYSLEIPKNNWEEVYLKTKNRDTIKELFYLTEDFKEVKFDGDRLVLTPKPILKRLVISGNRSFWDSEVLAITGLREGYPVDMETLENIPLRLKQFYNDNGYFSIKTELEYRQDGDYLFINIKIDEGRKSKLRDIRFFADQPTYGVDVETFKKVMGLKSGKVVKFSQVQDVLERLKRYLYSLGYYDSNVELKEIKTSEDDYVDIDVLINFGTKYIVRFSGNRHVPEEKLKSLLTFSSEGFNYYQLGQSLNNIIQYYNNQGFLNFRINFEIHESEERVDGLYPNYTLVDIQIEEGNKFSLGKIRVDTDVPGLDQRIESLFREKFYKKKELNDLLEKAVSELRKEGYLTAKFEIDESLVDGDVVDLEIRLFKGEMYILKAIYFENYSLDKKYINIKLPKIYNPYEVLELQDSLRKLIRDKGYYDSEVLLDIDMEKRGGFIDVIAKYFFELKDRYKNGFLFVYGSKYVNPKMVVYQFPEEEDYFDNKKLEMSLDRLYVSKLFESVNLYLLEDREKKVINRAVFLHDDKRGLFQGSVGYSTDQQLKVSILGVFKNLFGYGFEASGYLERSNLQTNYRLSFGNRLLPSKLSSFISMFNSEQYRRYFDLEQKGYELSLEKRHNLWVSSSILFSSISAQVFNSSIHTRFKEYSLNKLALSISDDHRDSKVDPHRGYITNLKLEGVSGNSSFTKVEFHGKHFLSFFEKLILSQRLSGGYIFSDIEKIPLGERYFLGGISSLRGFALEEVAGESKTGGSSFLLLNNDVRLSVYPKYNLYLFSFIDLGNVYKNNRELSDLKVRKSAGLGFYLPTPVGALIFDVAKKLDKKPGEDSYRIEFSIGGSF